MKLPNLQQLDDFTPVICIVGIACCFYALFYGIATYHPAPSPTIASPADEARFLRAIAMVESGGKLDAVGKGGELGEYQLSAPIVIEWMRATGNERLQPTQMWLDGEAILGGLTQTQIATWHLHQLETSHFTFDAARLAKLWRGKDDEEYCQRVLNLYNAN